MNQLYTITMNYALDRRAVLHLALPTAQSMAGERKVGLALLHIVQYEL